MTTKRQIGEIVRHTYEKVDVIVGNDAEAGTSIVFIVPNRRWGDCTALVFVQSPFNAAQVLTATEMEQFLNNTADSEMLREIRRVWLNAGLASGRGGLHDD